MFGLFDIDGVLTDSEYGDNVASTLALDDLTVSDTPCTRMYITRN